MAEPGDRGARRRRRRQRPRVDAAVLAEALPDGILVVDAQRRLIAANSRFRRLWATDALHEGEEVELLTHALPRLVDPAGFTARVNHLHDHPEEILRAEIVLQDGLVLEGYSAPLTSRDGEHLGRLWRFRDISTAKAADLSLAAELESQREQLDYLAQYDPLTGLPNRALFTARLQEMLTRFQAQSEGLAVLMADLECFRWVSSIFGTAAGDQLLREVSARLLSVAGGSSTVGRILDDVFGIAFPLLHGASDLVGLQERLSARLSEPVLVGAEPLRFSPRFGVAMFPADGDTPEALIGNADAALRVAKSSGQRWLHYSQDMGRNLRQTMTLESRLRSAVEREEFVLHYQPKIDLRTRAICGAEALLRWRSRDEGLVPPGRFVPLLEQTGLIVEVGLWVLRRAMADHQQWLQQGLPAPRIAVNISALQLRQPDFLDRLSQIIGSAPGRTPALDLEVTESMLMSEFDANIIKLRQIREMGVSVAVDDFGIGFSSLAYLARLPIDMVKIDRSFVVKMSESADALHIVSAIISLGRSFGLQVVAEGVDSEEQLKLLRLLRCEQAQGFLFSPGVPAEQFAELLLRQPPAAE